MLAKYFHSKSDDGGKILSLIIHVSSLASKVMNCQESSLLIVNAWFVHWQLRDICMICMPMMSPLFLAARVFREGLEIAPCTCSYMIRPLSIRDMHYMLKRRYTRCIIYLLASSIYTGIYYRYSLSIYVIDIHNDCKSPMSYSVSCMI